MKRKDNRHAKRVIYNEICFGNGSEFNSIPDYAQCVAEEYNTPFAVKHLQGLARSVGVDVSNRWCKRQVVLGWKIGL